MKRFLGVLLLAGLAGGCGSDSSISSGSPGDFSPANSGTSVVGRAILDVPLAGAGVTFLALDGSQLATTNPVVTDDVGFFDATLVAPIDDFVVVVHKDGEAYASLYQDYRPGDHAVVTPLTNLWAARLRSHPNETLDEAAGQLRGELGLPPSFDLRADMGTLGHRAGFVARTYLRQARASGDNASEDGFSPFVSQTLAQLESNPGGAQNGIFSDKQARFWAQQGSQLGVAVETSVLMAQGVPVGGLIGWGIGVLFGPIFGNAEAANFQKLAEALEALGREIEEMYQEVSREIAESTYTTQFNLTKDKVVGPIQAANQKLHDTLVNGVTYAQKQSLAAEMSNPQVSQTLSDIDSAQQGDSQHQGLLLQGIHLLGVDSKDYYSNETVFNPLISEFNYFASLQTQAVNLLIEGFHALEPPDPVSARGNYEIYTSNLSGQASQMPQPLPSDEVIYLTKEGLVFYRRVIGPGKISVARKHAEALKEGPFKKWHVASESELKALLGAAPNHNESGLEAMGFDFSGTRKNPENGSLHAVAAAEGTLVDFETGSSLTLSDWSLNSHCYLLVADLSKEQLSSAPESYVALGRLKRIRLTQNVRESRLQAFGDYTVNVKKESVDLHDVEISNLVHWSVLTNPSHLRVQNVPSDSNVVKLPNSPADLSYGAGVYTWLVNSTATVNVTASARDPFDSSFPLISSAPLSLSNSTVPPPTLQSIRLGPKEPILNSLAPLNLTVLGFYSDGSNANLNAGITWSHSIPEANVLSNPGGIVLTLSAKPSVQEFTVTASANGTTDSARFFVNIP